MNELWTDKYAPRKLEEIVGNAESIQQIKTWALDWQRGKRQKALLLHGPPGTGKTAAARALAQEMSWILFETNASNMRDGDSTSKIIGLAATSGTLFGGLRLILFDEVDGVFDRGEVIELTRVLADPTQPIILTANDVWNPKLAPLRASTTRIEFKKISKYDIKKALTYIAEKEGLIDELTQLHEEHSKGDVRSAVIDLQSGTRSSRQREENVFEGIRRLFKSKNFQEATQAQDNSAVDFDLFARWIEENIPLEYEQSDDRARAFDALSRSSVFGARIQRRQNWDLLKFRRVLALAGVGCAKNEVYRKFTPYRFPAYVKELAQSQKSRAALKSAARKAGEKLKTSMKKTKQDLAYYAPFFAYFGWNEEEKAAADNRLKNHGNKSTKPTPQI